MSCPHIFRELLTRKFLAPGHCSERGGAGPEHEIEVVRGFRSVLEMGLRPERSFVADDNRFFRVSHSEPSEIEVIDPVPVDYAAPVLPRVMRALLHVEVEMPRRHEDCPVALSHGVAAGRDVLPCTNEAFLGECIGNHILVPPRHRCLALGLYDVGDPLHEQVLKLLRVGESPLPHESGAVRA